MASWWCQLTRINRESCNFYYTIFFREHKLQMSRFHNDRQRHLLLTIVQINQLFAKRCGRQNHSVECMFCDSPHMLGDSSDPSRQSRRPSQVFLMSMHNPTPHRNELYEQFAYAEIQQYKPVDELARSSKIRTLLSFWGWITPSASSPRVLSLMS